MSAILELEQLHSSDCPPDCECVRQGVGPADLHGDPRSELLAVVEAQSETTPLGWWQIFCVEDDGHMETAPGSLDAFVEMLIELKWGVVSAERHQAVCPNCQDPTIVLSEDEEREDAAVYEARGK